MIKFYTFLITSLTSSIIFSTDDPYELRFTHAYETCEWGTKNRSGGGSRIERCYPYVFFLNDFLKNHNIKTVLDLGCGTFSFSEYVEWNAIDYLGIDVVKEAIETNIQKYGSENIKFMHGNILDMDLPDADLVLCKHVLQHIPNEAVFKFLEKIKKFKYCLLTDGIESYDTEVNINLPLWGTRPLNLFAPPFNLPGEPIFKFKIGQWYHQVVLLEH